MYRRNPIRQILIPLPRNQKPGLPNHPAKLLLTRKLGNTLHEVLITRAIPRHHLPNHRDRVERPLLVHGVEQRILDLAELEAREDAAGLEHAECFFQGDVFVREIADAERDGVQINRVVRDHVQLLSVGLDEPQPGTPCVGCLEAALLALGQHLRVDVCDGDVGVGVVVDVRGVVEHAEGDVARAAGDVEDVPALLLVRGGGGERVAARVEVAYEVVFPQAVDAEGHEVVHVVVAGRYRGEDAADWGGGLAFGTAQKSGPQCSPRCSFSASAIVSNPKCVVPSCVFFGGGGGGSLTPLGAEAEKVLTDSHATLARALSIWRPM
jgi:hypothetical protein